VGWIATIGVLPSFQRRGLGRQLLNAAEEALNLPVIKLTVRVSNQPALTLYKQEGYIITNRLTRYYSGGEDGFVMEKRRQFRFRGDHLGFQLTRITQISRSNLSLGHW
jgi:ribosomal-protein-alanine N-acetyltransferase